jgi:acetyltransferase-like isoleucine patch superfamily enzyme
MTQEKIDKKKSRVSFVTYLRRDLLQIHPKLCILTFLHFLAMNCPVDRMRIVLYKLRGTKIGKNVNIAPQAFLEEGNPELITIKENTDIGPRVMIATHHTAFYHINPEFSKYTSQVIIGKNCYIGAGVIILPGVTIGDDSIVGAGAVVTKSIPPGSVAMGVPAKVVCTREEWGEKIGLKLRENRFPESK